MTLTTGQSLSFYEIRGSLGAGAMGVIHRDLKPANGLPKTAPIQS